MEAGLAWTAFCATLELRYVRQAERASDAERSVSRMCVCICEPENASSASVFGERGGARGLR